MKVIAKPIDVLAYFYKGKCPMPIRFRILEQDENNVISIDKIITTDKEKIAGNFMYVYRCNCTINGLLKEIELKYDIEKCSWILYKA